MKGYLDCYSYAGVVICVLCVRYYTVPKKETKKFHRDSGRNSTEPALVRAVENALAFLDEDVLPVHWDRQEEHILFHIRQSRQYQSLVVRTP
jgi:hypothetical protein